VFIEMVADPIVVQVAPSADRAAVNVVPDRVSRR
jgi:hypothetical protein